MFHKVLVGFEITDHDCTHKLWSCDTVGPRGNEADVGAAATGAGDSQVQYMVHQFYWKEIRIIRMTWYHRRTSFGGADGSCIYWRAGE
jgi:hypothetical protein